MRTKTHGQVTEKPMPSLKLQTMLCLVLVTGCSVASSPEKSAATEANQPSMPHSETVQESTAPAAEPAPAATTQQAHGTLRPSYKRCVDATGGVTPAIQDCMADEYRYQDDRLNRVYQSLLAKRSKQEQEALRAEQRTWLSVRDRQCPVDPGGGQGQRLDTNSCLLKATAERASELEAK